MNCPKPGYYVLTADVRNPKADRRCRGFMNVPVWKAGTRVKIKPRFHGDEPVTTDSNQLLSEGIIEGMGGSYVLFGGGEDNYGSQGNAILDHIKEEPERLGYVLRDNYADANHVLAQLLGNGSITMEQVKSAIKELADWSEEKLESVMNMYGV